MPSTRQGKRDVYESSNLFLGAKILCDVLEFVHVHWDEDPWYSIEYLNPTEF